MDALFWHVLVSSSYRNDVELLIGPCDHLSCLIIFSDVWQIALESVCVIDDGETMLVEGLRVAPQERGKGVAGVLLRFCSELVKSKYPDIKVSRLTRDDQLGPKDFQKYRIITKQVINSTFFVLIYAY